MGNGVFNPPDWSNILNAPTSANQSQMEAAADFFDFVTAGMMSYSPFCAKAWGKIDYAAGVPSLTVGKNVSSVTDTGLGIGTINLTTPFSSADFCAIGTHLNDQVSASSAINSSIAAITASTIKYKIWGVDASGNASPFVDKSYMFSAFGDQ